MCKKKTPSRLPLVNDADTGSANLVSPTKRRSAPGETHVSQHENEAKKWDTEMGNASMKLAGMILGYYLANAKQNHRVLSQDVLDCRRTVHISSSK